MISLNVGPSDADDEDDHEKIIGRNSRTIDEAGLESVANALNQTVFQIDGTPVALLRQHCRAMVEGGKLIVMDSSSLSPNSIEITGPGSTLEVFNKIVEEFKDVELIREGMSLYVIEN